jgi:hypothetical protein
MQKFQLVERQVRTAVCRQKCVKYRAMSAMMFIGSHNNVSNLYALLIITLS